MALPAPPSVIELSTGHDPVGSVLWLHGLGADAWDFVPIVQALQLPETLALRFVFPNAPKQAVTMNGGMVMRAWYDIALDGLERQPDDAGIKASAHLIEALIARELARGVASHRIALAGFSQGGVIILQVGTRYPQPLAGLLPLSTYLAQSDRLRSELHPANAHTPILMAHGTQDNVIPLALAERSKNTLLEAGFRVDWRTYPMAHSVANEEVRAIRDFLIRIYGERR